MSRFSRITELIFVSRRVINVAGLLCRDLDLKRPIYQKTACYGHFGRKDFPWEIPKNLNL